MILSQDKEYKIRKEQVILKLQELESKHNITSDINESLLARAQRIN